MHGSRTTAAAQHSLGLTLKIKMHFLCIHKTDKTLSCYYKPRAKRPGLGAFVHHCLFGSELQTLLSCCCRCFSLFRSIETHTIPFRKVCYEALLLLDTGESTCPSCVWCVCTVLCRTGPRVCTLLPYAVHNSQP